MTTILDRVVQSMGGDSKMNSIAGYAQRLYSFGVGQGSRVALSSSSRAEVPLISLAVMSLGGTVVVIDPDLPHLTERLEVLKCEVLIVELAEQYLKREEALDDVEDLIHILSIEVSQDIVPLTPAQSDSPWLLTVQEGTSLHREALILVQEEENLIVDHQKLLHTMEVDPVSGVVQVDPSAPFLQLLKYALSDSRIEYSEASLRSLKEIQPERLVIGAQGLMALQQEWLERAKEWTSLSLPLLRWSGLVGQLYHQQMENGEDLSKRVSWQYSAFSALLKPVISKQVGGSLNCIEAPKDWKSQEGHFLGFLS